MIVPILSAMTLTLAVALKLVIRLPVACRALLSIAMIAMPVMAWKIVTRLPVVFLELLSIAMISMAAPPMTATRLQDVLSPLLSAMMAMPALRMDVIH